MKKRAGYTLSKADLVEKVYHKMGYSRNHTEKMLTFFFDIIKDSLKTGAAVKISRFGKFFVRAKKARKGRNPKTGEPVMISARKVTLFHPSSQFKKELQS